MPKTKARIMRRETTVPKVPEDAEEEKKLKQGKAAEKVVKVEDEEKSKDEDEDMSDMESDSEEESAPKANGKNVEPAVAVTAPTSNRSGDDAKGRYQKILETRMAEIQHVFAKGAPFI